MHRIWRGRTAVLSGLWLLAACGNDASRVPVATTTTTRAENTQRSRHETSCKKDSDCPSGRRCGFTGAMGCEGSGTCVVAVAGGACVDPGGRCGCDGKPVDLFCAEGSSTEFASAPVGSVGPCPISCRDDAGCSPRLVCREGICVQPHNGRSH
jgi:hypothetical protein